MNPEMMPFVYIVGIPFIIIWITDCIIKKRSFLIIIYFFVLILFWILFSVGLYEDLKNDVGLYTISDWNNFPYLNFCIISFTFSFVFSSFLVLIPTICGILNK